MSTKSSRCLCLRNNEAPDISEPNTCVCKLSYVLVNSADVNSECVKCPLGTNCMTPGVVVHSLDVVPGFWRDSALSIDVRACPSTAPCVGGSNYTALCDTGYSGPYCAVCDKGYSSVGSSPTGDFSCELCVGSTSTTIYIGLGVAIAFIVAIVLYCCCAALLVTLLTKV